MKKKTKHNTIVEFLSLIRIHNLLGIALFSAASVCWVGADHWGITFVLAVTIIAAGGYSYNDVCDIKMDTINRPNRPLVKGIVSRQAAITFSWISTTIGIILLASTGTLVLLVGLGPTIILAAYSRLIKNKSGFLGNVVVASNIAIIPIMAGLHTKVWSGLGILSSVGFGITLIREVLKDLEDAPGDQIAHRHTLATSQKRSAINIIIALSTILTTIGVLMFIVQITQQKLILTTSITLLTLLISSVLLWYTKKLGNTQLKKILKLEMFAYTALFLLKGVL